MGATRFTMGFKPIAGAHSQNAGADSAKGLIVGPLFWECQQHPGLCFTPHTHYTL
jgi:hypothetical protein